MMYFIYILYSPSADKYYVGHTDNPERRFISHNTSNRITYTSKYRPWKMVALFQCSEERGKALMIERFIKKQKSRSLIMSLVTNEKQDGMLAHLVRVPHERD